MKLETTVYDKLKKAIPEKASKTILFASVADTNYEIFFYSFFANRGYRNCYEMAESDMIDAHLLDEVFASIAEAIKENRQFHKSDINVFTFVFDEKDVRMETEYFDKTSRSYRIKKDWEKRYLI